MFIKKIILYIDTVMKIYQSNLFDKNWYIKNYRDLSIAYRIFPAIHYALFGWKEGRNPGPNFNTSIYMEKYNDVKNIGINPLYHYEKYGKKEGRDIFSNNISKKNESINQNLVCDMIKSSKLFDIQWYVNNYLSMLPNISHVSPILNFSLSMNKKNPGPAFYSNEYRFLNQDIGNIEPFLHYEHIGKYEDRAISFADLIIKDKDNKEKKLQVDTVFSTRKNCDKKIVVVYAIVPEERTISLNVISMLQSLNKISDYTVVVSNNTLNHSEINDVQEFCNAVLISKEHEYYFGSYKAGYKYIKDNNILLNDDSIIFINDLNVGPITDLDKLLNMKLSGSFDVLGLSYKQLSEEDYIEPNFYMINRVIYDTHEFNDFIFNIKAEISYANSYYYNALLLQKIFNSLNARCVTILPKNIILNKEFDTEIINEYDVPFISTNILNYIDNYKKEKIIEDIRRLNPDFKISKKINIHKTTRENKYVSKYNIYRNYEKKLDILNSKFINNEKINICFLVNMASMFPAEEVMCRFIDDIKYSVKLVIIPDIRFGNADMYRIYKQTFEELSQKYSDIIFHSVEIDENTKEVTMWNNPLENADIICYPSPYNVSYSLYNPYYAVLTNTLSFTINYGYYRSIFDRYIYNLDDYNNFWKVFLETNINYEEYRIYGQCEGSNSVVIGYAKMDRYAKYQHIHTNKRKKIIIAPHYSVNENTNRLLMLSNFEKYADLFLELPKKYPNIDFVFRPHPVLFTTLKKENFWGEKKVEDYIKKMKAHKNVVYSTEGDYLEIFASSDGIIQDCGSFLVEYLYTGKPCCYMLKSKNDIQDKFNELGIKCLEHTYLAYNEDEIINFIEDVIIKENDYMKEERVSFAEKEIMVNYPNVSMKIYEYINNYVRKADG